MQDKMYRKTAVALILFLSIGLVSGVNAEILPLGDDGEVAANSTNDRSVTDFTYSLYDSVRVSKTNGFVD